jgi:hypothetical protein
MYTSALDPFRVERAHLIQKQVAPGQVRVYELGKLLES